MKRARVGNAPSKMTNQARATEACLRAAKKSARGLRLFVASWHGETGSLEELIQLWDLAGVGAVTDRQIAALRRQITGLVSKLPAGINGKSDWVDELRMDTNAIFDGIEQIRRRLA